MTSRLLTNFDCHIRYNQLRYGFSSYFKTPLTTSGSRFAKSQRLKAVCGVACDEFVVWLPLAVVCSGTRHLIYDLNAFGVVAVKGYSYSFTETLPGQRDVGGGVGRGKLAKSGTKFSL